MEMVDPTTAVRTEALPAIATVVGPGAIASSWYAWLALDRLPELKAFFDQHEAIAASALVMLWIVTGFAIESAGSYVEVYAFDRKREDYTDMNKEWWKYLRIAWDTEPLGQHYLRKILVSFKFELNMFVSVLASMLGVLLLGFAGVLTPVIAWAVLLGLALASVLFVQAAQGTSDLLARLRKELLNGVGEPPFLDGKPTKSVKAPHHQ